MTILSALDGAQLSVSRYTHEASLHRILAELSITLIPLVTRSAQIADTTQASPDSPEHATVVSLYFAVSSLRNQAIIMAQELAVDEPRYAEALPLLCLDADPHPMGFSADSVHGFDVRVRQWRQSIYKFVQKMDPESPLLYTRAVFDSDPPCDRRIAEKPARIANESLF